MDLDHELLLETFVAESAELTAQMEAAVLSYEKTAAQVSLNEILRLVHTFKGNASCLGFDELTSFAHAVEDRLESARTSNVPVTSQAAWLLEVVDAFRSLVASTTNGDAWNESDHSALLELQFADAGEVLGRSEPAAGESALTSETHLRVGVDKLDRVLSVAGQLAVARSRLLAICDRRRADVPEDLYETVEETDRLSHELQEEVMKLRAVPIAPFFERFARTIRDVAVANEKAARLAIDATDVEVDTAIATAMRDPLTHMIRNAVDHGIEHPDEREANGKERIGTITLSARHERGSIVIRVGDDGRGISAAKVVARARELGRIRIDEALDDAASHTLIFEHGFSTAESISEISGRGVGMDIVRRSIEALRGTISVESEPGRGTTFTLRFPLTLAVIEGLAVRVADGTYVVPLNNVVECIELDSSGGGNLPDGVIALRGEVLPFVRLKTHFGISDSRSGRESVVIVSDGIGRTGLAVDELLGQTQTTIKPLPRLLPKVRGVSSSALLGTGEIGLVIDVNELVIAAREAHRGRTDGRL